MKKIDGFLIRVFQEMSNWIQIRIGWTCFDCARALVIVHLVIGIIGLVNNGRQDIFSFGVGCILDYMWYFKRIPREEAYSTRMNENYQRVMCKMRVSTLFVIAWVAVMGLVQMDAFEGMILLYIAGCILGIEYFLACKPLTKDEVKELQARKLGATEASSG